MRGSVLAACFGALFVCGLGAAHAQTVDARTTVATSPTGSADGIPLVGFDAGAVPVPSAAGAWGGPRSGAEATLSDRVVDYRIEAKLDPVAHTLHGREQLTWRNRSAVPVRAVYLHLYLNAFRNGGSTFFAEQDALGGDLRGRMTMAANDWGWIDMTRVRQGSAPVAQTFVHPDGGPRTDMTVVRLDLPRPVAPGASTTLDIDFHVRLPRVVARTGWFGSFHLVAQWFPKIGVLELPGERGATTPRWNVHAFHLNSEFYADFGSFDVTLDVPADYRVGATGERQGAPVVANGRARHRYVQHDVHDFAWTADNRYAEPLRGTWRGPGSPPVEIQILYTPEFVASAQPALKATQASLDYFSRTLGPYPYRTVTVVLPPHNAEGAAGMEYPTFFTAESYDEVPPRSFDAALLDFVTIHEFGHGYFYGILASNEFEEPLLDEGLNEYWDQRMLRDGPVRYDFAPTWLHWLGVTLPVDDPFKTERFGAMLGDTADGAGASSWDRLSTQSYGTVYARTALLMRDLEARLGKAVIERAFKDYYATWKFRHPSIADLRESLAVSTGRRDVIEQVFAQQVYAPGGIDDRVERIESTPVTPLAGRIDAGAKAVVRSDDQVDALVDVRTDAWRKAHPKANPESGPYPWRTIVQVRRRGSAVSQDLVVTFDDGSRRTLHWDDDARWKRFELVSPRRAVSAQLDVRQRYFVDASKLDDGRRVEGDASAARRWSADFASLFQTVQSLLVNL